MAKDGDILVADRPGGDLRPLLAGPEDDGGPVFSPDGTKLAFLRSTERGSALMLADADGTNLIQLTPDTAEGSGWSFAPDGRSLLGIAMIDGTRRVVVRPADPAAALDVLNIRLRDSSMELSEWGGPRFRPTNPQEILVVTQLDPGGRRGIYIYDLATGGIRTIVEPGDYQYAFDVAWLPDGEHIIYSMAGPAETERRIVAADGSGDQAFDALRGRVSPLSNDGTRIVAERGGEGDAAPHSVVATISGDREPIELACGPGAGIACPTSWIWSPDDSTLIGINLVETSIAGDGPLTETYLQADPNTGRVTPLDWVNVGIPAWQRVAP